MESGSTYIIQILFELTPVSQTIYGYKYELYHPRQILSEVQRNPQISLRLKVYTKRLKDVVRPDLNNQDPNMLVK